MSAEDWVGWSESDCRLTRVGRWSRMPSRQDCSTDSETSFMYASPSPMNLSSRMPMTSAMKLIIVAVSRTVSPWAICDFASSRSCSCRPSRLVPEANEKRVRVELSRKLETARPDWKMRVLMLRSRRFLRASATRYMARSSSVVLSHVCRKSLLYMFLKSSLASCSRYGLMVFSLMAFLLTVVSWCYLMSLSVREARNSVASPSAALGSYRFRAATYSAAHVGRSCL